MLITSVSPPRAASKESGDLGQTLFCEHTRLPSRGTVNSTVVTKLPPKLTQLKGCELCGMKLEYVKCFNVILQKVVLLLGQGRMEPVTLWALASMHRLLCRGFKLTGSPSAWGLATNGILHGCSLSMVDTQPVEYQH